jgi:hypothetical protein
MPTFAKAVPLDAPFARLDVIAGQFITAADPGRYKRAFDLFVHDIVLPLHGRCCILLRTEFGLGERRHIDALLCSQPRRGIEQGIVVDAGVVGHFVHQITNVATC